MYMQSGYVRFRYRDSRYVRFLPYLLYHRCTPYDGFVGHSTVSGLLLYVAGIFLKA
jgi:hypothetical protein